MEKLTLVTGGMCGFVVEITNQILGGWLGDPEEDARAVVFLISKGNKYD